MSSKSRSTVHVDSHHHAHHKHNNKPRDFSSEGVKNNDITNLPINEYKIIGALTAIGFFVRLFRLSQPSSVVFDEVHFGGFASKYIKGKFFMDVHPPLAKMLLTLAGWLAGFDGGFDFKDIGKDYLEPGVPYVAMRLLPALCGVATIPIMFLILKTLGCKTTSATLGAGLVLFENGLVTQSRLILLDSPLIFFTAFTALAWNAFMNLHEQGPRMAFTKKWWTWLALSGLGLGATVSVKWVGLFTIAWVGSLTALQLWTLLGDSKTVTPRLWFKHFFARVFCLIVIPVAFYMAMFAIHFRCLVNPGDGDGFMSSEFQATLNGKGMADVPADVALGSKVTIRHHNTQGGYLHSHNHMYPTGSKQQQITLYPHADTNNVWIFENQTQPLDASGTVINGTDAWDKLDPSWVMDGTVLRLYHTATNRRLHSHDVRPPVSEAEWQNEVSAYGYDGFDGDANDYFRVEIVKSMSDGAEAKTRVRTIETKFRLIHLMTGCAVFSHKVKLPKWGFEQQEVTCARQGTLPNSIWYVESNEHAALGLNAEKVNYRNPGFIGKFWELQKVMWVTNAGLVESHAWDSRPPSWPILNRGINFWGKDSRQIYLIGNPLIWLSTTAAIAIYIAFKGLAIIRWQRSCNDYSHMQFKRFDYELGMSVLGWAFHYFPFFLMQRQLFLHHYFPALYFGIIVFSQLFDFVTTRFASFGLKERPMIGQSGAVIFLAASIIVFMLYAPLGYGNQWTKSECKRVQLVDTWDWDCNTFPETYADYSLVVPSSSGPQATSQAAHVGANPPVAEKPEDEVEVTAPAKKDNIGEIIEETVDYRDENGRILDEEEVKSLSGKVSFSTRYETRIQHVAANGQKVLAAGDDEESSFAGTIAEGENPETTKSAGKIANGKPASNNANEDVKKEQQIEAEQKGAASPEPSIAAPSVD